MLPQTNKEQECLKFIELMRKAIEFELSHQYINAIGKTGDFANFIKREAISALKFYPDSLHWNSIKALVERYAFLDLASRMSICTKIVHNLDELKTFYETEINRKENKTVKHETLENIDPELDISTLKVQYIKGIGPQMALKLNKLEIFTCEDLLNYLPRDHISYSSVTPISSLEEGMDATIMGHILKISSFKSPKKNLVILSIFIKDHSGKIKINKFLQGNSSHFYLKQYLSQYPTGSYCICVGKVKKDKFSKSYTLQNPVIELVSEDFSEGERDAKAHTAQIVPIYPLTEGVSLMNIRKFIHRTLAVYKSNLREFIPEPILKANHLMNYAEALEEIHFPSSLETKDQAATRLLFSELFLMQLRFMQLRHEHKKKHKGIKFNLFDNSLVDKFISSLPFELTFAQQRVFYNEILPDMVSSEPMHRLLQGDVGSGKTIVAFLALLVAVSDGYQGAIMVPTEILAEQHYRKFQSWVSDMGASLGIRVAILIGKQKAKEKREVLERLKDGSINIVVGTHALIQTGVEFKKLGLIVIDEQHRFGVKQRELLARKALTNIGNDALQLGISSQIEDQTELKEEEIDKLGSTVEKLFMTATPIPRTLALATHGDLDMSEIDEMPLGRLPIITQIVRRKQEAYNLIQDEINKGNQAYIVFPLIDESETLSAKAATVEYEKLRTTVFQDYRIGLIHGKLKDEEKESVMEEFRLGNFDILVSTTVIEVGVDVPNATVILIESSERFGLAQLHQLRGRVGRNDKQSYCLLASSSNSENSRHRLSILEKTTNGFLIAQEDLKLRGSGDITGLRQSGIPESTLQSLINSEDLMIHARNAAKQLVELNPELDDLNELKKRLGRYAQSAHLSAG